MTTLNKDLKSGRFLLLATSALLLAGTHSASAQVPNTAETTASPGRAQKQFEKRELVPQVGPNVEVKNLILQNVPEGAENITFQLTGITLDGASAYKQGALESFYADKIGTTISLADVYAIATALTNKYRNDGYILTQVVVPPQTIESGDVHLQVVEGYIDQVIVEGTESENELSLIRHYASHIRTGQALNVRDLERYLLLINDLPGVEARSVLSPSKTQTGAADLLITVSRDPIDGLLAIDNFGSRYLGPDQATAAVSFNSLLNLNEKITLEAVGAPIRRREQNELAYIALEYDQPVWDEGTKLLLSANHINTQPGYDLKIFKVKGRSDYFDIKLDHPLIRSRSTNLNIYTQFDWRDVYSKNILDTSADHIRSFRFGTTYQFLDTIFGVGVNQINLEISKGVALWNGDKGSNTNASRPLGDPTYFKGNLDIQRLQRITSHVNLLVAGRGQWAAAPLLSAEEFGVGGFDIGRAYDTSEIVGDDGVAGKIELQWDKPYRWDFMPNYQLFGFYDAGTVWNQDATTSNLKQETRTSAGFGIRTDFTDTVKGGAAVAFPLNHDIQTENDNNPRVYLNLSKTF